MDCPPTFSLRGKERDGRRKQIRESADCHLRRGATSFKLWVAYLYGEGMVTRENLEGEEHRDDRRVYCNSGPPLRGEEMMDTGK